MKNQKPYFRSPFVLWGFIAGGIILPAGALAFLGFRSFRYETILLEDQTRGRYGQNADAARAAVQASVREMMDQVSALARWRPVDHDTVTLLRRDFLFVKKAGTVPLQALYCPVPWIGYILGAPFWPDLRSDEGAMRAIVTEERRRSPGKRGLPLQGRSLLGYHFAEFSVRIPDTTIKFGFVSPQNRPARV